MDNFDMSNSSIEMEKVVNSLFYVGGLLKGFPPTMSPSLEDFGFMQYAQEPLRPAPEGFRIMMNVSMFQPQEVEIHVLGKKVIEIRTRHDKRQNADGLWMARNCVYTYDLPPEVIGKELHAEWSDDNFLCIQATQVARVEDCEKVRLVPQHVQTILRPIMEAGTVKELFEDIRDKALLALRYVRFHHQIVPSFVVKQQPDKDQSTKSAPGSKEVPVGKEKEVPVGKEKEEPVGKEKEEPVGKEKEEPVGKEKEEPVGKEKEEPVEEPVGKEEPVRKAEHQLSLPSSSTASSISPEDVQAVTSSPSDPSL